MEIDKAEYSKKDVWWIVTKTVIATFVLTMIYSRFLSMEKEIILLREDDLYNNERIDKKTARNKEFIDENHKEIETLKIPNTDSKKEK